MLFYFSQPVSCPKFRFRVFARPVAGAILVLFWVSRPVSCPRFRFWVLLVRFWEPFSCFYRFRDLFRVLDSGLGLCILVCSHAFLFFAARFMS